MWIAALQPALHFCTSIHLTLNSPFQILFLFWVKTENELKNCHFTTMKIELDCRVNRGVGVQVLQSICHLVTPAYGVPYNTPLQLALCTPGGVRPQSSIQKWPGVPQWQWCSFCHVLHIFLGCLQRFSKLLVSQDSIRHRIYHATVWEQHLHRPHLHRILASRLSWLYSSLRGVRADRRERRIQIHRAVNTGKMTLAAFWKKLCPLSI